MLDQLEKQNVLKDFDNLINPWCEHYAKIHGIPKDQMCKVAKKFFGDDLSESKIQNSIKPEFKIAYRIENGKQKETPKPEKVSRVRRLMDSLGISVDDLVKPLADPLWQTTKLLGDEQVKKN